MKFEPGQSGNPAGRPLGARNKKTIAVEEMIAEQAEAAVQKIVRMAEEGDPTAMRLCMERMSPSGANRRLALELPRIKGGNDAEAALELVLDAFRNGEISIRELSHMLSAIDRLILVGDHIDQLRHSENFRREADQHDWESDNHWPPYHDTPNAEALEAGRCICPCRRDKPDGPCAAKTGKYRASGPIDANGCLIPVTPARNGNADGLYFPVNSRAEPVRKTEGGPGDVEGVAAKAPADVAPGGERDGGGGAGPSS